MDTATPTSNGLMQAFAYGTQTICTQLYIVPNQPIVFASDVKQTKRSEDQIMSFGWKKFLENTTGYEWLPHLPMTKSGSLAMDVIQDFSQSQLGVTLEKFTVAGASKRGW